MERSEHLLFVIGVIDDPFRRFRLPHSELAKIAFLGPAVAPHYAVLCDVCIGDRIGRVVLCFAQTDELIAAIGEEA
jgi:hypothetical protein